MAGSLEIVGNSEINLGFISGSTKVGVKKEKSSIVFS